MMRYIQLSRRAPYGARGLKCTCVFWWSETHGSRPVWGAWIEMLLLNILFESLLSRPVWGAWIEMNYLLGLLQMAVSRAPYGARGLKYLHKNGCGSRNRVAPRMGRVD